MSSAAYRSKTWVCNSRIATGMHVVEMNLLKTEFEIYTGYSKELGNQIILFCEIGCCSNKRWELN